MRKIGAVILAATLANVTPAAADDARIIAGLGNQMGVDSAEMNLRYVAPEPMFWNFNPAFGLSVAGNGSAWVGVGTALTFGDGDGLFTRITSMVGAHRRGSGRDLGGALQFRNALDIGYRWTSGVETGLGADHRSNAGLNTPNPGVNTVYLFASMPLK